MGTVVLAMRTLTYHDVVPYTERDAVGFLGPLAARYKLDPGAFEAHLQALAETGLRVGTFAADRAPLTHGSPVPDGLPIDDGRLPQVLLSFDDGGSSALHAATTLEQRGWRGHFFVTTSRLGTPGFMSVQQVRDLVRRGHVVGSHSHTHPTYMGNLSRRELDWEWRSSRAALEEILGEPPTIASVPGGYLSDGVAVAAAAAGYEVLFTSEPTARVQTRDIVVCGRYTIWSTTPAAVAAAYACGKRLACGRLWLEWNAKKLAKSVSPPAYELLRRVRAG